MKAATWYGKVRPIRTRIGDPRQCPLSSFRMTENRMIERRTDVRVRRFKAGTIVFNDAASVFDCTVRNISATGACLLVASPLTLPAEFELMIEGERRPCAVAWRRPDRVGVEYQ